MTVGTLDTFLHSADGQTGPLLSQAAFGEHSSQASGLVFRESLIREPQRLCSLHFAAVVGDEVCPPPYLSLPTLQTMAASIYGE